MGVRRLLAGGAMVAVLAVTGCSGGSGAKVATLGDKASSSSGGDSAASDSKQSFQDALLSYAKCMRDHGVDMPDPTFDDDGSGKGGFAIVGGPAGGADGGPVSAPNADAFKAADTECKPIMDAATKDMPKPSAEEQAKMRDQALAFAKCMREHGVDMPDPTFDDGGAISIQAGSANAKPSSDGTPSVNGPSQEFQDAAKACQTEGGPGFMVSGGSAAEGAGGATVAGGGGR